jgi:hypothetical protein
MLKAKVTKEKLNFIKIENGCALKENHFEHENAAHRMEENICNHVSKKELESRM